MIFVGTSGWQYDDWRKGFYPNDLPTSRWLEHFSRTLPTVEVNNTFYRLPSAGRFAQWHAASAPDLVFAVKASGYITHIRRLREALESVRL